MDEIFHGANYKYVTILREPVAQFESMFYYFQMDKFMPAGNTTALEAFLKDPAKNFEFLSKRNKRYPNIKTHNEQSFDLGVELDEMNSSESGKAKVKQLGREFDLVMLEEYFDESLLLLRKLLGWSLDDIRYISHGIRKTEFRYPRRMDDELRAKIRAWNSLDVELYEFFNRTFWKKVEEYGSDFERDLGLFRKKLSDLNSTCVGALNLGNKRDKRVIATALKGGAPKWCSNFIQSDTEFTALIRKRMIAEGVPLFINSKTHRVLQRSNAQSKTQFSC